MCAQDTSSVSSVCTEPRELFSMKQYKVYNTLLGEGTQAKVYLGFDTVKKRRVAVKVLSSKNHPDFIKTEVEALLHVRDHSLKHSLKLLGVGCRSNSAVLVTEFIPGKQLHDLAVAYDSGMPERLAKHLFAKLLLAVDELHQSGWCHLDLKLENILYTKSKDTVTLIDFGFAEPWLDETGERKLEKFCGSIHYTCPEIGMHLPYSGRRADIWALGVILYCLVAGRFPFNSSSQMKLLEKIQKIKCKWPAGFSLELVDLISSMFTGTYQNIGDYLHHPWFSV